MAGEIVHWNVNGLKSKRSPKYNDKINTISSILEKSNHTFLLNIQETHLPDNNELPDFVKTYDHMYDYISTNSSSDDPYSGILIFIRKTEEILRSEVLETGRLIFLKVQNKATKQVLHIFSIYCNPSNSAKQKLLINKIEEKIMLENLENITILGDFNFVTSILDRNSQSLNRNDLETMKNWIPFEGKYNLQDSFRLNQPHRRLYSFSSRANATIKSRIDRIYLSSNLCGKALSTNYFLNSGSDHKIVKLKMAFDVEKGPGLWVFNNTVLKDDEYTTEVKHIINESSNVITTNVKPIWDIMSQKIMSFSRNFSQDKAKKENADIRRLEKELEVLENLHTNNLNLGILERIVTLKSKITKFQNKKLQGALLRSKIPKFEENEPNINFISSLEKRKGEENTIYSLLDNNMNIKSGTQEVKEVIYDFYSNLYKSEPVDNSLQDEFLSKIDIQITPEQKEYMDRDLSETELFNALLKLNDDRSPGHSGLTKEFFVHFWQDLKPLYLRLVKKMKEDGDLTEMQKRGAIKINFKKGDRKLIKNYCPITLLNIDLKIITKAIAERFKTVISSIIHQNQTCVPGRQIADNIHITQNLIDHINEVDGEAALIFLDQEKAFDRMSHSFII